MAKWGGFFALWALASPLLAATHLGSLINQRLAPTEVPDFRRLTLPGGEPLVRWTAPEREDTGGSPGTVWLIRHGEKPLNAQDKGLAQPGWMRAYAWVPRLLSLIGEPVDEIWAPRPRETPAPGAKAEKATRSARALLTILPLALSAGVPAHAPFGTRQVAELAEHLLKGSFDHAVVAWNHDEIVPLTTALGVSAPEVWADDDYSTVWRIDLVPGGESKLHVLPQELLSGDRPAKTPSKWGFSWGFASGAGATVAAYLLVNFRGLLTAGHS